MGSFIDYHGIDVRSPNPTGDAGLVLNNNFKELADRVAPTFATGADPTVNDDEIDTAGNGKFYIWSKWLNTANGALFVCTDATATAAVWTHFHCGTTTLTLNGTQVLYLPDQTDFNGTLIVGNGGTNLSTAASPDGKFNTIIGLGAFDANTEGDSNNVFGYQALEDNTIGVRNIALGYRALRKNIDGDNNVAIGDEAMLDNTTGSQNVCIGALAGEDITGDGNICIGYMAGEGQTAISNRLYIDNSDTATPLIYGEFDNDLVKINGDFYIPSDTKKIHLGIDSTDYTIQWDGSDAVHTIIAGDFVFTGGNMGINEVAPQDKLEVNGTLMVKDKLIFTQDDRDEYIDSLNDGFIDYGATTAHRFLNHVKLTGDNRKLLSGAGDNASFYYDSSNLVINPKEVGTGKVDIKGKVIIGTFGTPEDVTVTRKHGLELFFSGNNYDVNGMRLRASLITTNTTATASGAEISAANADGIDVGVLNGALIEAIGKSSSIAATITTMRGLLVGTEWNANDTVTTMYGEHLRVHSRNNAGAGSFGTGYGLYLENEAVGGNGQALDAAIYFKGTALAGGNNFATIGLDMSGSTITTADIKLQNSATILNVTSGYIDYKAATAHRFDHNIELPTSEKLQLRDSAIGIYSQADTFLDLFADGSIRIGDSSAGAPTNYTEIKSDGEINLHGTARVFACEIFESKELSPGASGATETQLGDYIGYAYTINDDTILTFPVDKLEGWETGTDLTVIIRYYINEAYVTNSGEIQWEAAWSACPSNGTEAVDAPTHTGTIDSGDFDIPTTAKFLKEETLGTIAGASVAAGDEIGITFKRVALDGGNNPAAAEPVITCVGIVYTRNKLGTAT